MCETKSLPKDALLPSKVNDQIWIYVSSPDPSIDCSDDDVDEAPNFLSTIGKWMLFCNKEKTSEASKGLAEHDYAWLSIKRLVQSGQDTGIKGAKCSTAHSGHTTSKNGLICCYTRNFADKVLAKKAADSIRQAYKYPGQMYYKTDNDTYAGKYVNSGHSNVSIYRHTPDGRMYERDPSDPKKWKLLPF